jgi:hypothetical protein
MKSFKELSMETEEQRLRRNITQALIAACFLMACVLIEGFALWHAGRYWEQARWTAGEAVIPAASFCLMGVVSIIRVRKQVLPRSSK